MGKLRQSRNLVSTNRALQKNKFGYMSTHWAIIGCRLLGEYSHRIIGRIPDWSKLIYNDVMSWKRCLHYWPFVRGIHRWRRLPFIKFASNMGLRHFVVASMNNMLLNKQSRRQWFETPCARGTFLNKFGRKAAYWHRSNYPRPVCLNSIISTQCFTANPDLLVIAFNIVQRFDWVIMTGYGH